MLASIYLAFNAVLYLALSLVCSMRSRAVMQWLGYLTVNQAGRTEFFAIYGGLQLGLAAFFSVCASSPAYRSVGVTFAALLYLGIVLCRAAAMWRQVPVLPATRMLATAEILMLGAALGLLLRPI